MSSQIILLIILILLSGIFSASETALTTLSKGRVHALVKNKIKGARRLEKLKSNPGRFLTTILVGNNIVNILASIIATLLFTDLYGNKGPGIAMGVMTFVILVFGEITPKSIAIRFAEFLSLLLSPLILLFQYIFFPIIWVFEHLSHLQSHFFIEQQEKSVTEEELIALASIGAEEGSIQRQEKELIENVLEFNDIEVQEIMSPRTQIDALDEETTLHKAANFINEHTHTKIPVYRESIDNVVGVITVREILENLALGPIEKKIKEIELRKPYAIPTAKRINVLLRELQRRRQNMAIVIDDHGGTAGIVTIEDILEEIVGEIVDEHEIEEEPLKVIDKNTILVQGKTPVYAIKDALQIDLGEEDYKPISFLIFKKLKRIPTQGEKFHIGNLTLRIERMHRNRIVTVRIQKNPLKKSSVKSKNI